MNNFANHIRFAGIDRVASARGWRYRTHHRHADGATTADETTALVFADGLPIGWGESVLASILD